MANKCTHLNQIGKVAPLTYGCKECLEIGDDWVHLRLCLTCGHVGCCDDSRNKHASEHFHSIGHPIIESLEPGEDWRWCFVDEMILAPEANSLEGTQSKNVNASKRDFRSTINHLKAKSPTHVDPPLQGDKARGRKYERMFKSICRQVRKCNKKNLEPTIELAVEIAREGREGRRIGTLFTFGDADAVLERSRPLILDPLAGHTEEARQIRDVNLRGTIKELAQLDGAFVVSDQGIVEAACRYLDAMASDVALPYGMASRHLAGASISQVTDAVAIVVSESSMVRVFDDGKLVVEIIPELWLMDHYNVQLSRPYQEERVGDLAVLTAES